MFFKTISFKFDCMKIEKMIFLWTNLHYKFIYNHTHIMCVEFIIISAYTCATTTQYTVKFNGYSINKNMH